MADVLCPRCNAKGTVVVKQSRDEKGRDLKYYECAKCKSIWTNSSDITSLPVEGVPNP
jgi:DNA-directed RNA polymerase subunit M/transcription elongation factor TFIIS